MISIAIFFLLIASSLAEDKLVFLMTHIRHGARAPQKYYDQSKYLDYVLESWNNPGELTPIGQRMHYALGLQNREEYITKKKFLSENFDPHEILIYSTKFNRTLLSVSSFFQGLYPPGTGGVITEEQKVNAKPQVELSSDVESKLESLGLDSLPNKTSVVPIRMINKGVAKKIWETYDIIKARLIVNDAAYSTDVSEINRYIKEKEDELIHSVNSDTMFSPYKELYDTFKKYILEKESLERGEIDDDYNYRKYRMEFIKLTASIKDDFIDNMVQDLYNSKGLEAALDYIKTLSDRVLSNYIIDYHFEEVYYNVIIDIKELLQFYYDGNINLPK